MTDYFEIGRILKPQGVRGEVKVEPYTDDLSRLAELKNVFFKNNNGYESESIEKVRADAKFAYIKFKGIDNRDKAELLRDKAIYVDRENANQLPEGSYYIADLIGMKVFDDKGEKIGILDDIMQTGSKDIYVVKLNNKGTLLFPSVGDVIAERNIENGTMVIDGEKIKEVGIYDI